MTGAELRAIRLRLGLTQRAMATRLGVSRIHYNRMETGKKAILERTARHVIAIAPRTRARRTRR